MDDIIEFIIEVILEIFGEIMMNAKMPFIVRFLIYLVCSAFLISMSVLLVYCAMNEPSKLLAVVMLLLSIVVFGLFVGLTKTMFFTKK